MRTSMTVLAAAAFAWAAVVSARSASPSGLVEAAGPEASERIGADPASPALGKG